MPSSVVHAAVAVVLAAGLLGRFYDRRALAVVLAVVVAPELDTFVGFVLDGAHRTVFHTGLTVALAAALVYWETNREESVIRDRFGARGVRIAWVAVFVHATAHLAFDWTHLSGINIAWPLVDRFYALEGELYLSTTEGVVQTFVEIARDPKTGREVVDAGAGGTRAETHVSNPAQPSTGPEPEPDPEPVDRRFPIAVGGWQLYAVCAGLFVLAAKRLQAPAERFR